MISEPSKNNLFIEKINIKNFKVFNKFNSSQFSKINIITGKNNAGKSSLLEALYLNLGAANPFLWINITARRGISIVGPLQNPAYFLFHNSLETLPLYFKVTTSNFGILKTEFFIREPRAGEISIPLSTSIQGNVPNPFMIGGLSKAIIVEQIITLNKNKPRVIKTILSPNGISFDGDQSPLFPDSVFLPSEISPSIMHDEVQRYDVINKLNLTEEFDNYLRKIEPRLKRTSLSIYNGMTVIHADVGFGLVPLSILGSGSYKLANIYLSFIYARNGVVLIDEIENSFHYSMLDTIWSSIAELSQKFNIQVFAVTHSNECLKSAFVTLKEKNIKDFSIHRLDRKEGIIKMHKFEEKQLESLISAEWDLR